MALDHGKVDMLIQAFAIYFAIDVFYDLNIYIYIGTIRDITFSIGILNVNVPLF